MLEHIKEYFERFEHIRIKEYKKNIREYKKNMPGIFPKILEYLGGSAAEGGRKNFRVYFSAAEGGRNFLGGILRPPKAAQIFLRYVNREYKKNKRI